jgi:hypothetical protein
VNTRFLILTSIAVATLTSIWAANGAVLPVSAHEPHPGLQFSISVQGITSCDTRHGDATCSIPAGATFPVAVNLDGLPADVPSYGGFDIYLKYDGVTPLQDASDSAWPDCGYPASHYGNGFVGFGCSIGVSAVGPGAASPSTYIGLIGTNSFTCDESGSIALVHGFGSGHTDLIQDVIQGVVNGHSEGDGAAETINIICASPLTPDPTPTPVLLPAAGQQPPTSDTRLISHVLIAALFVFGSSLIGVRYVATKRR